jgi:hypothetical protein
MRSLKSLLLGMALLLILNAPLYALTVSPSIIKNNFKAGESMQGKIHVYNEGDIQLKINIEFSDWEFKKDGLGSLEFKSAGSMRYSCADWIQAAPMEFELAPKESRDVNYAITFPIDAQGGSYAAIFVVGKPKPPTLPEEKGKSVMVITSVARLAVLIYNEALNTPKKVYLNKFDISRPNNKSLQISFEMKNEGSGYVRAEGKFHIMDNEGKLYGSGTTKPAKMQQGDSAKSSTEWLGELPNGEYDVVLTLELKPFGDEVMVKEKKIKIDSSGLKILE